MPLQSSKGKESESGGKLVEVHNTANLGQAVGGAGGGGGGGGAGNVFKMTQMTPTGVNGGITTHSSTNNLNYPNTWISPVPGPFMTNPGPFHPQYGGTGTMFKFNAEFSGDIRCYLWGGGGGSQPSSGGRGGEGGFTAGTVTVSSGQNLYVVVGEGGGAKFDPQQPWSDTTYAPYGNRSGGPGGDRGSGGGFTGIFVGSDPTDITQGNAVLMAGGGGGAGGSPTGGAFAGPGGGAEGMPGDYGNNSPTQHTLGGTQNQGGRGGQQGSRTQGGTGVALLGGNNPGATGPFWGPAGGGGGYYGGGGQGDNSTGDAAGGSGYIGGHPQAPVADTMWCSMPTPNTPAWSYWPNVTPYQNSAGMFEGLRGKAGYGGAGPAGGNQPWGKIPAYGTCGRVVIQVLQPE